MKIAKAFILSLLGGLTLSFAPVSLSDVNSDSLIGTWEFVEMLDKEGQHIDTLWEGNTFMIPKEPNYTFRSDSTYFAQFTETDCDTGTWAYNSSGKEILLKLYWEKPYNEIDQYIISLGYSKKDEKGDYYDIIHRKISELTSDKLVILKEENRKIIYKKIK